MPADMRIFYYIISDIYSIFSPKTDSDSTLFLTACRIHDRLGLLYRSKREELL
ncbi:MAG: hypothetical protein JW927_08515 [Deltaproteobacteria bacterium]|nr:hypothetical protein [Deltaproteobacteria bacterium]